MIREPTRSGAARRAFYAGVAVTSAATLMLQIIETRILSVIAWYHLAFLVISVGMLGLTVGAVWVYLRAERFAGGTIAAHLSRNALAFSLTSVAGLVVQMTIPAVVGPAAAAVVAWVELILVLAVPFAFAGVVVSLALTRSPYPVPVVYAVDLAGAALGCVGVLLLLNTLDGPSAVIAVAGLAAAAAVLFSMADGRPLRSLRGTAALCVLLMLLAAVNAASPVGLRPLFMKGRIESTPPSFSRWNSFSRVGLYEVEERWPAMWGPSPHFDRARWPVEQKQLTIDGDAGTVMYHLPAGLESAGFLRYDVTNFAHYVRSYDRAAVIGIGAGRDLLSARLFGVADITGIELNPIFTSLLTKNPRYRSYAGIDTMGIRFETAEARSWMAASSESFDLIQMSLIDTWAATGAGAFTLSENGLYTVEAWQIFFDRLTPHGVLTVSRWMGPGRAWEAARLLSLALEAGRRAGTESPRDHVLVVRSGRVVTLLYSRSAFSDTELAAARGSADRLGFEMLVEPDAAPADPVLAAVIRNDGHLDTAPELTSSPFDFRAPTDDRPFFFNQLRLDRPIRSFRAVRRMGGMGVASGNLSATITLAGLFCLAVLAVALTILLPLRSALHDVGGRLIALGSAYFGLIGVGFMSIEIALLQRMSVFLGHPIYSLSVVLFSIIVSAGAGSLISGVAPLDSQRRFAVWWGSVSCYLLLLSVMLGPVLERFDAAGLPVRVAIAVAVIVPAGTLMGWGFPTGMRLAESLDARPTPWFWGINGAAGVLASIGVVGVSLVYGIRASLVAGAGCYLLLLPVATLLQAQTVEAPEPRDIPIRNPLPETAG